MNYTTINQSKKLTEILPIESADMFWLVVGDTPRVHVLTDSLSNYSKWENYPCWSLAALLDVLPNKNMLVKTTDGEYYCLAKDVMTKDYDNPIDACYEMILKLHELNLL